MSHRTASDQLAIETWRSALPAERPRLVWPVTVVAATLDRIQL